MSVIGLRVRGANGVGDSDGRRRCYRRIVDYDDERSHLSVGSPCDVHHVYLYPISIYAILLPGPESLSPRLLTAAADVSETLPQPSRSIVRKHDAPRHNTGRPRTTQGLPRTHPGRRANACLTCLFRRTPEPGVGRLYWASRVNLSNLSTNLHHRKIAAARPPPGPRPAQRHDGAWCLVLSAFPLPPPLSLRWRPASWPLLSPPAAAAA